MKTIGIILIVLGIAGATTMSIITYSFTHSYSMYDDATQQMEELIQEPQTPETMQEMQILEQNISSYSSSIARANRNIYIFIGLGALLTIVGFVLIARSRKNKT